MFPRCRRRCEMSPPLQSPSDHLFYFDVSDTKYLLSRDRHAAAYALLRQWHGKHTPWMQMMHQTPVKRLKSAASPSTVGIMLTERSEQPPRQPAEMPLVPIDRQTSLGELAYTSLKEAIVRGEFSAGQKLTVRAVAQALGVSTTPARDAIMRLIGEGALVNAGPKTVIVPPLTKPALDEVTSIRLVLEGLAARSAAENVTKQIVDQLKALQAQINTALDAGNYSAVLKANKAF